ncbi:hypothetical protein C6501_11295 [Candidatus Poribacteria bacterium]|nr:MAG: hypothetical protein C6501_11295 [Candidatus Poribacteria bacterium]
MIIIDLHELLTWISILITGIGVVWLFIWIGYLLDKRFDSELLTLFIWVVGFFCGIFVIYALVETHTEEKTMIMTHLERVWIELRERAITYLNELYQYFIEFLIPVGLAFLVYFAVFWGICESIQFLKEKRRARSHSREPLRLPKEPLFVKFFRRLRIFFIILCVILISYVSYTVISVLLKYGLLKYIVSILALCVFLLGILIATSIYNRRHTHENTETPPHP